MSEATLSLAVVLKDGASSGLGALGLSLGGLAGSAYMLSRQWEKLSPTTKALGVTAGATGLLFGGLSRFLRSSVDAATQLEAEMNKVQITVNGAAEAGNALTTTLVHIADTSIYTTAQVADAFSQLGIDGYNATDIMNGLGQATIDFAEAAQTQTVPAALLLGSTMRMFGAQAQDATRYANDLTFAMYNGQKSAANLQVAIAQVGPVASIAGVNFNELAVALAFMGQQGFVGTRAGTALRYMIAGLTTPTSSAAKEMKNLGLAVLDASGNIVSSKFFDAQGHFIGIANSVDVLHKALVGLDPQQQMQALKELFSVRGGQGAELFLKNYAAFLSSFNDLSNIEKGTSVVDKASKVTDTFAAAINRVKTTWNDFKAMLGQADLGPLKTIFNDIANALDKFNTASPAVHTLVGNLLVIATAGSGILFAASSLGFMVRAAKELGVLKELGKVGEGFKNIVGPARELSTAGRALGESFGSKLVSGFLAIPNAIRGIPGLLAQAGKGFMGFLGNVGQVASQAPALLKGAFSNALGFLKDLPGNAMAALRTIPSLFTDMGGAALDAVPAILGLSGAILPIVGIALAVAGVIAIVVLYFTQFRDDGQKLVDFFGSVFGPVFDNIKNTFEQVWKSIQDTWNSVYPQVKQGMDNLTQALINARPVFEVVGAVIQIAFQIVLHVLGFVIQAFIIALPPIIGFFTNIINFVTYVTTLLIDIFTGKWGKIPEVIGKIFGSILGIITAPLQAIWGPVKKVVDKIVGFFSDLVDRIKKVFGPIIQWFKDTWNKVKDVTTTALDGLKSAIAAPVRGIVDNFQSGMLQLQRAGVFGAEGAKRKILEILNGVPGLVWGIGKQIADGLANGMYYGTMAAGNAASNIAKNVVAHFKSHMVIQSPSRVMHELGQHVSNGLINGIKSVDVAGQAMQHWSGITKAVPNARAGFTLGSSISYAAAQAASAAAGTGSANTTVNLCIDGKHVGQVVIDRVTGTLKQNGAGRLFR